MKALLPYREVRSSVPVKAMIANPWGNLQNFRDGGRGESAASLRFFSREKKRIKKRKSKQGVMPSVVVHASRPGSEEADMVVHASTGEAEKTG